MRRWLDAGVFEALVADVQSIVREWAGRKGQPTAVCLDSRTLQSTPESGARAGYDCAKRRKGSKVHIAVDTLGHLLALKVTTADQGDREQVAALAEEVQQVTGSTVELAYVDQGVHWAERSCSRTAAWHPARSGQTPDGQTRLRASAPPLGRGTKLRLGRTLPTTRPRLQTARHNAQRLPLHRLRSVHDQQTYPNCTTSP